MTKGAMTLAEGSQKKLYKTDATLVLNGCEQRDYVLRTAFDSLAVWKAKYAVNVAPFYPRIRTSIKEVALIDNEIWVFGVDGTNSQHIVDSVKIATQFYLVQPKDILSNIYIKNLNAEGEHENDMSLLVKLNMALYENTLIAISAACRHFGIASRVNVMVYSSNINPKIPRSELHKALKAGGAKSIQTDGRKIKYRVGNNSGKVGVPVVSNLHSATLDF